MRHRKKGKIFGRDAQQRAAMFNSLTVSLIEHGRIITTEAKAKELVRVVEPLITHARKGTVASRRLLSRNLPPKTVKKLVDEIAPRFKDRPGGYTRRTRLGRRKTDDAPQVQIELL